MDNDRFSDFEKYLAGGMSEEERSTFEQNLESDPELKQDFTIYRRIETDMRAFYRTSDIQGPLRETLERLGREYVLFDRHKEPKRGYFLPFLKGVAAVLLVLAGVYVLYLTASKGLDQEVATYYADNYSTLSQTMGQAKDEMQRGIAAYNQKKYEVAEGIFSGMLEDDPENSEALRNLGLSYLAMGDYANALRVFEQYGRIPDLFVNDGRMLQAVTLLMRGEAADDARAKVLLQQIVSGDEPGSVQAEAWLKKFK
ncbi:tetratricopeptide repeat protein [Lunatimonas salinarum]|uniref:tetratricopeptide repeat protein n=1 Tax=Lunatimonas salinarum TaxID=1774590 RepID=UPI001AE0BC53|nr:tetratricopeptide repeat protein [Lunatimonas salinarum]